MIHYPQWWMMFVAILVIVRNQSPQIRTVNFIKHHHTTLNLLLGTQVAKLLLNFTF